MPNACLSILPYVFLVLDRHLLANAIGHSMLLSGAMSLGQLLPFLVCSKLAPSPTPEALVSKYISIVAWICHKISCMHLLL